MRCFPALNITSRFFVIILVLLFVFTGCKDRSAEVPGLIRQLNSSQAKVRNQAALSLGHIGSPDADRAAIYLIKLLYDENVGVQSSAAYALRRIDTPEARAALERARNKNKRK